MNDNVRNQIRKLLKNFGIMADEALTTHLSQLTTGRPVHVRITLQDLTDYGDAPPEEVLHVEIDGRIHPENQ